VLLVTLAGIQFTNILDFMILMPLAPALMRLFEIDPRHFGMLVSAYTFAAAASGFVAAFWIDRFSRKRALLAMYAGFIVATALCGFAPSYELLLAARIVAGIFGGVIGALVFTIIADVDPLCAARTRRRPSCRPRSRSLP
jgi:predicted MFS family arabinose efflux permease